MGTTYTGLHISDQGAVEAVAAEIDEGHLARAQVNNPNQCIDCHRDLGVAGVFYGAGDGRGQKFRCEACHWRWRATHAERLLRIALYEDLGETVADNGGTVLQHLRHDAARLLGMFQPK